MTAVSAKDSGTFTLRPRLTDPFSRIRRPADRRRAVGVSPTGQAVSVIVKLHGGAARPPAGDTVKLNGRKLEGWIYRVNAATELWWCVEFDFTGRRNYGSADTLEEAKAAFEDERGWREVRDRRRRHRPNAPGHARGRARSRQRAEGLRGDAISQP